MNKILCIMNKILEADYLDMAERYISSYEIKNGRSISNKVSQNLHNINVLKDVSEFIRYSLHRGYFICDLVNRRLLWGNRVSFHGGINVVIPCLYDVRDRFIDSETCFNRVQNYIVLTRTIEYKPNTKCKIIPSPVIDVEDIIVLAIVYFSTREYVKQFDEIVDYDKGYEIEDFGVDITEFI